MSLDATDIAEIVSGFEIDIQNEQLYRSESMDSSLSDNTRIEALEDAYLCHLKVNRECKLLGKKMFDKHLKVVVEKEFEELEVLTFEAYVTLGTELMEKDEHLEDYGTD